jgi:hypothetical protein
MAARASLPTPPRASLVNAGTMPPVPPASNRPAAEAPLPPPSTSRERRARPVAHKHRRWLEHGKGGCKYQDCHLWPVVGWSFEQQKKEFVHTKDPRILQQRHAVELWARGRVNPEPYGVVGAMGAMVEIGTDVAAGAAGVPPPLTITQLAMTTSETNCRVLPNTWSSSRRLLHSPVTSVTHTHLLISGSEGHTITNASPHIDAARHGSFAPCLILGRPDAKQCLREAKTGRDVRDGLSQCHETPTVAGHVLALGHATSQSRSP